MLKHVWNCEHLSKGLYWCFQCQKPERVGKFQCTRCQGGSSRADRIANVAKRVFSALGARRVMDKPPFSQTEMRGRFPPKISEASELCEPWNSAPFSTENMDEERQSYLLPPYLPELPDNHVSEMEDTYVLPEMSGGWNELSRDTPAQVSKFGSPYVSSEAHIGLSLTEASSFQSGDNSLRNSYLRGSPRPTLSNLPRINTNTHIDGEALMHPPESRFNCLDNTFPTSLVSPISPTGGFDFGTLDTLDVSPTDSEASGNSLFTDSGYSTATLESSWNGSDMGFDITRSHQNLVENADKHVISPSSEIPKRHLFSAKPLSFPQSSTVTHIHTMTFFNDTSAGHPASRCNQPENPKSLSPHWSDAKSLVNSLAEVLHEHLNHSRSLLKQMASNVITRELLSLSFSSIVSIGFGVLAGLLEGRRPTATVPLFAFTHIAYALAITVDHDSSKVQKQEWFQDLLSSLENLASERQRQIYTQIVRVIWQPRMSFSLVDSLTTSDSFADDFSNPNENRLIRACMHFLDSKYRKAT